MKCNVEDILNKIYECRKYRVRLSICNDFCFTWGNEDYISYNFLGAVILLSNGIAKEYPQSEFANWWRKQNV